MTALAIHVLGYIAINLMMPPWAHEAGWYILAMWYGAFTAVDLIALMCCRDRLLAATLAISAAWSGAITLEVSMLSDVLQSNDWIAQILLTALIVCAGIRMLVSKKPAHDGKEF